MPAAPKLSIVTLSWNTQDLLRACLASLRTLDDEVAREVIVVDNASSDGSADMVAHEFPEVRLIRNAQNEGYARGNNIGMQESRGEYVLLLNSDTEVQQGTLDRLCWFLDENGNYGAVGGGLRNGDGTTQAACMRFPTRLTALFFDMELDRRWPENPVIHAYYMRDYDHETSRDVDQPPGACLCLRRSLLERIGLFDETLWLFFNDVDLCKRVWEAGARIRYLVEAPVIHHVGSSTAKFGRRIIEWQRNRRYYYRKHFGLLGGIYIDLMVRWRRLEERRKIKQSGAERAAIRRALGELDEMFREIMEPIERAETPALGPAPVRGDEALAHGDG